MKNEVFNIEMQFEGKEYTFKVKADLPVGPEPFGSDYDIYLGRKHIYTLNQCKNEDEVTCWEIRKTSKSSFTPEFAQEIGNAIDKYYG